ncbi:C2 domain-containing protein [Ceratobasidium sp. AG-Ba]|nr:C2 domain-containing protein [Ceratobasidium sp. AG-Ba]
MSSSPREIGTLIVVVLRAKNLPNKRHIGKQDPYCSIRFNTETRRTKAVKRGGQHPEWDEEVRFQIYEDAEDELARTAGGDKTPPPKERFRNIKGGKTMRLSCYADDPRDPDLIGEAQVDLTEALTKGEVDEWFTLNSKDKYAGEVYLEMTFWSKEKPPAKKKAPRPSTNNPQYGGPGSFTPSSSASEIPAALRPNRESSPPQGQAGDRRSAVPESLRPSSSALGDLNLYIPPYSSQNSLASHGSLPTAVEPGRASYDELGVMGPALDHRRRDSFPVTYAQDLPASLYGHHAHPSNASISSHPSYQQSFDPFSTSSIAQSISNMHIGQPPPPSVYPPTTPAPSFNPPPSQFGYPGPANNIPPPFPQGPGYQPGYGPPNPAPYPPNGQYQPGFPPPSQTPLPPQNGVNQTVRIVSSGFAPPPPIPTPMPFNVPLTGAPPFQPPPNPSHTPFPQQHPFQHQAVPSPQGPPVQNGPPSFTQPGPYPQQSTPFSPQATSPAHSPFSPPPHQPLAPQPPQQYPQSTSPPRGPLPPVPQSQSTIGLNGPPSHQSAPPPPQQQQYHQPQQYPPPPQNFPPPPPPLQQYQSNGSRPLPTPHSSSNSVQSVQSQGFEPQLPGAYPQSGPNGQQWHGPGPARASSLPPAQTPLPGPPPPLPSQHQPPQMNSPPGRTQYQANAEHQLPPPPSAYQPPPPNPQQHSVPVGGIFPGPSTTSVYPGPPPKPPQMVPPPEHYGWQ